MNALATALLKIYVPKLELAMIIYEVESYDQGFNEIVFVSF
jgi:hypothetical protein